MIVESMEELEALIARAEAIDMSWLYQIDLEKIKLDVSALTDVLTSEAHRLRATALIYTDCAENEAASRQGRIAYSYAQKAVVVSRTRGGLRMRVLIGSIIQAWVMICPVPDPVQRMKRLILGCGDSVIDALAGLVE